MLCIFLCAVSLGIVTTINKFGLISIAAFIVIVIIKLFKSQIKVKNILSAAGIILIFVVAVVGLSIISSDLVSSLISRNELNNVNNDGSGYLWSVFVGSNYKSMGTWNYDDYAAFYESKITDSEALSVYRKELVSNRYNDYLTHPFKYMNHLNNKMIVISKTFNTLNVNLGGKLNRYIAEGLNGYVAIAVEGVFSLINIIVSFILLFSCKLRRTKNSELVNYYKLLMIGVCACLLVVEVAAKYSSILLFIYLTIAVLQIEDFNTNISNIHSWFVNRVGKSKK